MAERSPFSAELQRLRGVTGPRRPAPGDWTSEAACQGLDPDEWRDDEPGRTTAAARAVCAACPVRAACLAHPLACDEPWGV